MSYNFKSLSEVELLNEVPEGCTALAEVDGVVKRVPSKGLGGAGGIKTAIIKDSMYDNAIGGVNIMGSAPDYTYECINMTFEEAYQTMENGEPLACFGMLTNEGVMNMYGITAFPEPAYFDVPCIGLMFDPVNLTLFWTAEGLSTDEPPGAPLD